METKIKTGLRLLFGLMFTVFGLNGFFGFIPMPQPSPEAGAFFGAMMGTGYFVYFVKFTETVVGLMLLANVGVPLALVILAPISLNILAFNLFLEPASLPLSLMVLTFHVALAWMYRVYYSKVLTLRAL